MFPPSDLVRIHHHKEWFPEECKSNHMARGYGPFKVLHRINDNTYKIDTPTSKWFVSNTFNSPESFSNFHVDWWCQIVQDDSFPRRERWYGGYPGHQHTNHSLSINPIGIIIRDWAKDLQDKANIFIYTCDCYTYKNGLLPHANTICVIGYEWQNL